MSVRLPPVASIFTDLWDGERSYTAVFGLVRVSRTHSKVLNSAGEWELVANDRLDFDSCGDHEVPAPVSDAIAKL